MKKILLVEDDPNLGLLLQDYLQLKGKFEVVLCKDGEEGLRTFTKQNFDLLILDVMIPAPDGFAVCRELRKSGQRMPILMLTARDAVEDRISGLDHGADDYLTKPFEFRELLARLRALLRRTGRLQPAKLMVADLVVDTVGQNVSRGGRAIAMTAKEYALVEFLARNAGRVVGRAEIAEHVWDEEFDPFSNLIEVYVNRVRRKIDADSAQPLLHTRRGAGYVLSARDEAGAVEPKNSDTRNRDDA